MVGGGEKMKKSRPRILLNPIHKAQFNWQYTLTLHKEDKHEIVPI